jgi:AcrR family transcriptional regulator
MSESGEATRKALLDAAEDLLISEGAAGITNRKVANRAGVNRALVYYHFHSMEELLIAVLERVAVAVTERSDSIYAHEHSFLDGWFKQMEATTTADFERGWNKVWLEAVTLAANRRRIRQQYLHASTATRDFRERRVDEMLEQLGIDREVIPTEGVVTLLEAISTKLVLDQLVGVSAGHKELLEILRHVFDRLDDYTAKLSSD